MKSTFKKIIIVTIVFNLGLSAFPVSGNQAMVLSAPAKDQAPIIDIKVIKAEPQAQILHPAKAAAMTNTCQKATFKPTTLIQDQAWLNLNQPTGCLKLVNNNIVQPDIQLTVAQLKPVPITFITLPRMRISSYYYRAAPNHWLAQAGMLSAFALALFFIVFGFAASEYKSKKFLLLAIRPTPNLHQLMVMRC